MNLSREVAIAPWEAILGGTIQVPTLDGEVGVKIQPGTPSGQRLRLRGRGLSSGDEKGDLIVEIVVEVRPPKNNAEKELWEKLAKAAKK